MTSFDAVGIPAARPPLVFDRLAVFLALQAHLLAAITIVGSLVTCTSLAGCLLLLAVSLGIPLGCVAV